AERSAMTAPQLFDTQSRRRNETPAATGAASGLFANIVFDRPLDTEYTYAIPTDLVGKVGVGKRVEVPFGKGDKTTPGFVVRVTDEPPSSAFETKSVIRVLDDDALVDDHLMKLTR